MYHNTTKFPTRGGSSFCADAPIHDASMKQYPATLPGIMHRDGGFIGHGMRLCSSYRHQRTERIGSLNGDINKCRRFSAFVEEASSSPLRWCIVAMRRDINSPFASLVNIPAYTRCLRNRGTIGQDFMWLYVREQAEGRINRGFDRLENSNLKTRRVYPCLDMALIAVKRHPRDVVIKFSILSSYKIYITLH